MTVKEVLETVSALRAHPIPEEVLLRWLGELEGRVLCELHGKRVEKTPLPAGGCRLTVPAPYDRLYWTYLVAMVDLFCESITYPATRALFEEAFESYARECCRDGH